MATPESQSTHQTTHQSYTAGSCRLDVTSQLSALSQWSSRPIVQALTFKLWLSQTLVAEGDDADLQRIAAYVQSKTQSLLTVAALGAGERSPTVSPPPEILKLPEPTSYLQICDLTTVLSQHEQAAQTLPVALPVVQATASTAATPTATQSTADNVVSINAARRRPVRIAAARRQKNRMVWASSAAAALFAVGLTSALWSRDPALQSTTVESVGGAVGDSSANTSELEPRPSQSADRPTNTTDANQLETTEQPPPEISIGRTSDESTNSDQSIPGTVSRSPAAPTTGQTPTPSALPTQPPTPAETSSAPVVIPERPASNSSPQTATPAPAVLTPDADSGASEPSQDIAASADSEVPESLQRRATQNETESLALPPAAGQTDESAAAEAPPEVTFRTPRSPAGLSRSRPNSSAETFNTSGDAIAGTIDQVRAYFQTRWQSNEAGPLTYQLQIAETGEVVSFAALNEASQNFRDRILPTDEPPSFPQPSTTTADADETPQNLTLRIVLTRDGQVQISEF